MCKVIYKLVSKVLANILKPFRVEIVSHLQSAFIPRCLIMDNFLITYELMHSMKNSMGGSMGRMSMKLNISKAYDQVEWPFLKASMKAIGFLDCWIHLIITCVTLVQYSILVNGKPGRSFSPSRGLRQGDLVSSYLFLFLY